MRVALIHFWLIGMRGGERVLEQFSQLYPDADIYTHVYDPKKISDRLNAHQVTTTFIGSMPMARKHYQKYLPLMPRALEELDLTSYDLVISSESGPAKGVIPGPRARHVCYCHSPMRYIWDHYHAYKAGLGSIAARVFGRAAHNLRQWDVTTASRVDQFVANSSFVAERIERYYGRSAEVVNPPVDVDGFQPSGQVGDYYLFVSELVRYKRADLVVEAAKSLDAPVVIVGDGEARRELQARAPRNVTFKGRAPLDELKSLYAGCRALLFPGEEDFGIVPVEAMASGRPVIAFGRGGVLDSVKDGLTGLYFHEQSADALVEAIRAFEARADHFHPERIRAHAESFSEEAFRARFKAVVDETMARPHRRL